MIEYAKYVLEAIGAIALVVLGLKKMFWKGDGSVPTPIPNTTPQIEKAREHEDAGKAGIDKAGEHQQAGNDLIQKANGAKADGEGVQNSINAGKNQLNQPAKPIIVPSDGQKLQDELNEALHPSNRSTPPIPEGKND
jgi:hypothetical protein